MLNHKHRLRSHLAARHTDCDNGTGLPWEPCDGIRNPSAIADGDAPRAGKMRDAVQDLVFSAFLCDQHNATAMKECQQWAERAIVILKTWFLEAPTAMDPNLYYGQISPRASPISKGHGGFIEWTGLPRFLDHVNILRYAYPHLWTDSLHGAFVSWVKEFNHYVDGKEASGERKMENNHGTWFDNTWLGYGDQQCP